MIMEDFVTDMAVDAMEREALSEIAEEKKLSYDINQKVINLKNNALSEKIGRPRGVYVTFDCPASVFEKDRAISALQSYMAQTLLELAGNLKRDSKILVVGLGNDAVIADSLGSQSAKLVSELDIRANEKKTPRRRIFTFSAGVEGITGMKSTEVISSLCSYIKPSAVIIVDALATSSAKRLGTSFQITTSGIAPGSGVGKDKERIDKQMLGVPVIAIGVPLVLSMRTVLSDFGGSYAEIIGCEGNEYKLRELMIDKKLSGLIVAPKEIKYYVECAANIISGAVNRAFN